MKRFFKSLLFTCLTIVAGICVFYILLLWLDFASTLDVGYGAQMFIYLIPFFISTIVCIFLLFYDGFLGVLARRRKLLTPEQVRPQKILCNRQSMTV